MPLADQLVRASLERFRDLFAEPNPRPRDPVAADELPIEPGRAVACHLLIEVEAGEDPHVRLAAALGVISQGALLEIIRNEPAVRAEPAPPCAFAWTMCTTGFVQSTSTHTCGASPA